MGIAVLLAIIFSGVQKHPFGYIEGSEPIVTVIPIAGTSYISGMLYAFTKEAIPNIELSNVCILEHHVYFHRTSDDSFRKP